jgi:peptidoglycan/xylan/chitin deacetylase (PgdA/CDA1 family)
MLTKGKVTNYLKFVFKTKGFIGFFLRMGMLVRRFDLSGKKMKRAVSEIQQIGKKYGYQPALIIPSVVLKRYSSFFKLFSNNGLEFCAHGHVHRDLRALSLNEQVAQIRIARRIFNDLGVPVYGFRSPYLSRNCYTTKAIQKNHFLWESNETLIWKEYLVSQRLKLCSLMRDAIHLLYSPLDAQENVVIPRLLGEVVGIPVTLPDDEMLIDRFGIVDSDTIERIWAAILDKTREQGGIFVLQLHPERFAICRDAMEALLNKACRPEQGIWVTSMKEIADWWKEKSQFEVCFKSERQKGYRVKCECTDRAVVLCRNHRGEASRTFFYRDYHTIEQREFFVVSGELKPCIGVRPDCSEMLLNFLKDEGFVFEVSQDSSKYSLHLDGYEIFDRKDEQRLLSMIEQSTNPIIRYWRWPHGKRSAFVTSHDLDCLTLTDFLLRTLGK